MLATTALSLCLACREGDEALSRDREQFEVVSEGSAEGVTSTLAAPGETPAPLITDTNADTTTSFDILGPQTATTGTEQPGTLADILPDESPPPRVRRPRPLPTTTSEPIPEPPPVDDAAEDLEEEQPQSPEPESPEPESPPTETEPPTTTTPG